MKLTQRLSPDKAGRARSHFQAALQSLAARRPKHGALCNSLFGDKATFRYAAAFSLLLMFAAHSSRCTFASAAASPRRCLLACSARCT